MDGLGNHSMPSTSSSSDAEIVCHRTQLGRVAVVQWRSGLPASLPSSPESPHPIARRAEPGPVIRAVVDEEPDVPAPALQTDAVDRDGGVNLPPADALDEGNDAEVGPGNEADSDPSGGDRQRADAARQMGPERNGAPGSATRSSRPRKRSRISAGTTRDNETPALTVAQRREDSDATRRAATLVVIENCLRAAAGLPTPTAGFSQEGVCGRLVAAPCCPSRVVFCRFGPAMVDVAALWLSPRGKVLCSCRDHTQNVALASATGHACTCWHASCFESVLSRLSSSRSRVVAALKVHALTIPHSFVFEMEATKCALAFDGDIFSPVVATERRYIRCISFGCRTLEHSCTHAKLTRALPAFSLSGDNKGDKSGAGGGSEVSSEDGGGGVENGPPVDNVSSTYGKYADTRDDHAAIMDSVASRAKRNLLPCMTEYNIGNMWLRTADVMSLSTNDPVAEHGGAPAALSSAEHRGGTLPDVVPVTSSGGGTPTRGTGGGAGPHGAAVVGASLRTSIMTILVQQGVARDTTRDLCEKQCPKCKANKPDDVALKMEAGLLYTSHATAQALNVSRNGSCPCCCALPPLLSMTHAQSFSLGRLLTF